MDDQHLYDYRDYLRLKGYKKKTISTHLRIAEEYLNYTPTANMDFVAYLRSRTHLNNPKKYLSPNTLKFSLYSLKNYLDYNEKVSGEKTGLYIPVVKGSVSSVEILTFDEIEKLFACCRDLRDKAMLVLLYHLGLRIGEAARAGITDIDSGDRLLTVTKSKTGRQRQVPFNNTAHRLLQDYIDKERPPKDSGTFLQGLFGDLGVAGIEFNLKVIVQRTGITKRVYPHLLRHSIASHLLKRGMPLDQVSLFLGHASIESTRRYTHLSGYEFP